MEARKPSRNVKVQIAGEMLGVKQNTRQEREGDNLPPNRK